MAPPVVDDDVDTTTTTTAAAPALPPTKPSSGNGDVILLRVKRRREEPAPELLYVEAAAGDAGGKKKRRGRLAGLVEGMAALGTTQQEQEQRQQRRLFAFARVGTLTAAAAAEADAGRGVTVGGGGGGKRQAAAGGGAYREVRRLRCLGRQEQQQGEEAVEAGAGAARWRTHIIELARPATLLAAVAESQERRTQRQQQQQQAQPQQRRPHYIFRPLERELDEAIGTCVVCGYTYVGSVRKLTHTHTTTWHTGAALAGRAGDGTAARVLECVAQGADIDHQVCVGVDSVIKGGNDDGTVLCCCGVTVFVTVWLWGPVDCACVRCVCVYPSNRLVVDRHPFLLIHTI